MISFDAMYEVDAKILAMPLKGRGPVQANATDIDGKAVIRGHKETQNGRTFVMFDELTLKLKMQNYHIRLENLFNGDKSLGEAINLALNDNKKELMNLFRPHAEEMAASVLLERANQVTKHFDYDELFPIE
uniref:Protein takeout n=2 Tax=Lygus hesperus TaxID=30085 RepID=A0A0K8TGY5_LYGHE